MLENSEDSFLLPKQVPIGLIKYTLDSNGNEKIRCINEKILDIWEVKKEEVESDPTIIWGRILEKYVPPLRQSIKDSAKDLSSWKSSYTYETESGKYKYLECYGDPFKDGDATSWFVTIFDNTDSKSLKDEIEELSTKNDLLINIAMDSIIAMNQDQKIILFNKAAEELFQYKSNEVIGKNIEILIPHSYRNSHSHKVGEFGKAADTNKSMSKYRTVEGIDKNGHIFPIEASIAKTEHKGRIIFVAIIRDITAQKQAQEEIRLLNNNLEELVDTRTKQLRTTISEKEDILAILSHDLRSPLTAISLTSELIESNIKKLDPDLIVDKMKRIKEATDRSVELLDSILKSNEEHNEFNNVKNTLINPIKSVNDAVRNNEFKASAKQIELVSELAPKLNIFASNSKLFEVVDNLISNAIKFSKPHSTVTVKLLEYNEEARVEIIDEGPGLKESDFEMLFKKFAKLSAKPTNGEISTGLGLHICYRFMQLMNGKIWCESEFGKGAKFILSFKKAN